MSDLEIIDMHTHLQRSDAHGTEMRDYFLTPHLVKPGAPNLGTVPEFLEMMDVCGISSMNILMFTWSGRYFRHGQHTLPGDPDLAPTDAGARAVAEQELRERVTARASDNNAWAAGVVAEQPRMSFFAGVNPAVCGAEAAIEEVALRRSQGALGVKLVPSDMGVPGEDPLLFDLYAYCVENDIPVLTETGGHNPACRPAGWAGALARFPDLRLVFAHCGHDKQFRGPLDAEVLELAARYGNVMGDTSLRLHEVADGSISPEEMVAFIREIGSDRVMFGTNYVFSDLLPERPGHTPAPDHVDPRFTQVWKSVEVLKTLPLSDTEREALAAGNFRRLTGQA